MSYRLAFIGFLFAIIYSSFCTVSYGDSIRFEDGSGANPLSGPILDDGNRHEFSIRVADNFVFSELAIWFFIANESQTPVLSDHTIGLLFAPESGSQIESNLLTGTYATGSNITFHTVLGHIENDGNSYSYDPGADRTSVYNPNTEDISVDSTPAFIEGIGYYHPTLESAFLNQGSMNAQGTWSFFAQDTSISLNEGDYLHHWGITFLNEDNPNPVPEPATLFLLGTGLIGLVGRKLRKK